MIDLSNYMIIPTVKINNADDALALAAALVRGGIPIAEITFRTDAAEEAIRQMSQYPAIQVGAGSVTNVEQAKKAVEAGAQFIVCPGFNPDVADYCVSNDIAHIPGVSTATDIIAAINKGFTFLKFFPAETLGGVKMIKAISAPFPGISFMPTGGVNADNMNDYFALKCVSAVGGSWMVKENWIDGNEFNKIEEECRRSMEILSK